MPDRRGARWRLLSRFGFAALLQSIPTHRADGQAIPKPDYVTYLPRDIALPVQATAGNQLFHLFGDSTTPGYRDEAPRDGVDDARALWLRGIAVRFAPWMVRKSVDFPLNFRPFIEGGEASTLFIDAFDLSQARPRLLDTKTVDFGRLTGAACRATTAQAGDSTPDCRLVELVDRFAPAPPPAVSPPRPDLDVHYVMYFDFPGQDPASWNREFEGSVHGAIARKYVGYAKAFVHPFINEVKRPGFEPPRYELVLQYWFFYPYNDAGNVHEGDWEHINVVVTSRQQGAEPLSAATIRGLLEQPPADEQLLIRRVEYYFHHWVFFADYMTPDVYAPRAEWERQLNALREERVGEREVWRQLRRQVYLDEAETQLNLHPIVFIGGDNRGLQQLIAAPSRLGRASHGSYPFPGLYKDVGPQNTGELVGAPWDVFRRPPELVYRLVTAPIRARNRHAHPAFYGSEDVPFRFIGATVGVSSYTVPTEFLNLLAFPELSVPFLNQMFALAGTDSFTASVNAPAVERVSAPYYGISLFLGRRFVSENTLRHSTGAMRGDVAISSLPGLFPLTARLDMWEYTGSLRYNIAQGGLQPFVKAGYGRSWYRVTDARFNGQLLGNGGSRWVRRAGLFHSLLPNTWHVGGGLEFIPVRAVGRLDWGLRADLTVYSHNLGVKTEEGTFLLAQDAHVTRLHLGLGTTLSF